MLDLSRASRLVFMTGMHIQPMKAPRHQMAGEREKARMKFSLPMDTKSEVTMPLTRLFGVGSALATRPPASMATPAVVCTAARAASPALLRTMAGSAAL